MAQVLVKFDDAILRAIDRIAPADGRKRADFIRKAVKDALFRHDTEQMRAAYLKQPDNVEGADVWDLPEEWKP